MQLIASNIAFAYYTNSTIYCALRKYCDSSKTVTILENCRRHKDRGSFAKHDYSIRHRSRARFAKVRRSRTVSKSRCYIVNLIECQASWLGPWNKKRDDPSRLRPVDDDKVDRWDFVRCRAKLMHCRGEKSGLF